VTATGEPTTSSEPLLRVRDLETVFESRTSTVRAVDGVSFDLHRGEVMGLVGESGCGKSATIRSLLGLVPPPGRVVNGSVELAGAGNLMNLSTKAWRTIRGRRVGFVPQSPFAALNPILTIERQFANVLRAHHSISRSDALESAFHMLERVGIQDPERVLAGHAHELSGGMAQRVVIALAVILDPELIIADEPTTALDVTVQKRILDLLLHVVRESGRSMLLVTHDLGVVAHYCEKVAVMYAGRIVEEGPVRAVFGEPAHPYTQGLLNSVPRRGRVIESLPGRVPDLSKPILGCAFRERCRLAHDACQQSPDLVEISLGRRVACHLHDARATRRNSGDAQVPAEEPVQ